MRHTNRDQDGPRDRPAIITAPMIRELETDVRIRLKVDIRQLLQDGGVDSEFGEPSPEELHALVITTIERLLRARAYVRDVHAGWLDLEYEVRTLDPERIGRNLTPSS